MAIINNNRADGTARVLREAAKGSGYREREILGNAKSVTKVKTSDGFAYKIDTGRKTGSPTDYGVWHPKKGWIG